MKILLKAKTNEIQKVIEINNESIDKELITDIYNSIEVQNNVTIDLNEKIEINHNTIQYDMLKLQRNLCENMHSQNAILKAMADELSELR